MEHSDQTDKHIELLFEKFILASRGLSPVAVQFSVSCNSRKSVFMPSSIPNNKENKVRQSAFSSNLIYAFVRWPLCARARYVKEIDGCDPMVGLRSRVRIYLRYDLVEIAHLGTYIRRVQSQLKYSGPVVVFHRIWKRID
jgi:hypothetical protein